MKFPEHTHNFYTAVQDAPVENMLDNALSGIAADISALLPEDRCCVYLGGGYGRGEGGVFRASSGEARLYNDLDFFVFSRGVGFAGRRRIDSLLRGVAEKWGKLLEISVDFGPAKEVVKLPAVSCRLMFQELKHGHVKLFGAVDAMAMLPALLPGQLPLEEGIRLLLNRGAGLLLAGEKLLAGGAVVDFIIRNIYKCIGGAGDASLIASGGYAWNGAERVKGFESFVKEHSWPVVYSDNYAQAYRFKIEPWGENTACCHELWRTTCMVWKSAVDFLLGGVSGISSLKEKLHILAGEQGVRSWFNEVKWVVRPGNMPVLKMVMDPPLFKMLAELYIILSGMESGGNPRGTQRFYRNWKVIN